MSEYISLYTFDDLDVNDEPVFSFCGAKQDVLAPAPIGQRF